MRALIVTLGLAACSVGEPGPGIDVARALGHVAALTTIGPRPGDSPTAREAAGYIERELAAIGLAVDHVAVGEVALPEIRVAGTVYRRAHHVVTTDPDLVVRFRAPDQHGRSLLVMAHYDTVPASPGAVDDGAAVATLIELARVLHAHPPAQPVMLAFTANEERGLVGAEALADQHGDEVELAIALDLIGGSGRLSLNGASLLVREAELAWLADAADRAGVALDAPLPHRVISRRWPQAERADHGAFTRRGIRAFHLYHRGQDGLWIDLAYHSPSDVASRVHRNSVDELGRVLVALADSPVPAPGTNDGVWLPVVINTVVPRWGLLAVELALAAWALLSLVLLVLDRPHGGSSRRGSGLVAAIACVAVAVAVVVAVEHVAADGRLNPWLFTPHYSTVACALALAGMFGLATRLCARIAPWTGARRYLAVAIAMPLAIGLALVALGAAELAWIWLVPAAALALAPRLSAFAPFAILVTLLPCVLILRENQLVEAAYNGFLPAEVPLAVWVASLGLPCLAGVGWWARTRSTGPLVTLILPMGCGLSAVVGLALLWFGPIACSTAKLEQFPATCARASSWP